MEAEYISDKRFFEDVGVKDKLAHAALMS